MDCTNTVRKFRLEMESRGIKEQKEAAAIMGMSPTGVSKILAGETKFSAATVEKFINFCPALNWSDFNMCESGRRYANESDGGMSPERMAELLAQPLELERRAELLEMYN